MSSFKELVPQPSRSKQKKHPKSGNNMQQNPQKKKQTKNMER